MINHFNCRNIINIKQLISSINSKLDQSKKESDKLKQQIKVVFHMWSQDSIKHYQIITNPCMHLRNIIWVLVTKFK